MGKEKYIISDKINDFILLDKTKLNGRILYRVKCTICGEIKEICNLTNKQTTHGRNICKANYAKSFVGTSFGDFYCTDYFYDKRLFLILKCQKCGIERTVAEKDLHRFKNKHGYICVRLLQSHLEHYDSTIFKRLLVKYGNMKYRTTNPNYHSYDVYKNYECDYHNSCDFVLDYYDDYYQACDKFGIDNVYIDRIDNSKGYVVGNIRFVDAKTSSWNREAQTIFSVDSETYYSSIDFSKRNNVSHGYISRELRKINVGESFIFRGKTITKLS